MIQRDMQNTNVQYTVAIHMRNVDVQAFVRLVQTAFLNPVGYVIRRVQSQFLRDTIMCLISASTPSIQMLE